MIKFIFPIALLLAGCVVQSLTPFYDEASVIRETGAEGTWRLVVDSGKNVAGKRIRPWKIEGGTAVVYDEKGIGSSLKLVFFRAGSSLFVDVTADAPPERSTQDKITVLQPPPALSSTARKTSRCI